MSTPTDQDPDFPPLVMTFAASDPSGGAGIQADILTLASMGCHPLSGLTAITGQDTMGVEAVQAIDAGWLDDPARCLLEDLPLDAFKIGALGSVENIAAIAEILSDYPMCRWCSTLSWRPAGVTSSPTTRCCTRCASSCFRRPRF
jgi:hydroxymethylpyrimidine/phosphomethylpyrimidine kinase